MCAAPSKPPFSLADADSIPASMKSAPRWVNWNWVWKEAKEDWDKPPYRLNGRLGSSTDPGAWTTFGLAFAAHAQRRFDGLGFALGKDEATGLVWSGLDLDDCIDDGVVSSAALYMVGLLDSYTEVSPSGNGLKVFCLGAWPPHHKCGKSDDGFELYDGGRYFTITGKRFENSPPEVNERSRQLAAVYDALYPDWPDSAPRLTDREKAVAALKGLDRRRGVGYKDWLEVGMALHAASTDLLGEWDSWSSQACPEKYKPGICAAKWERFKNGGPGLIGVGSLIKWAKEDGWTFPGAPPARLPSQRNGRAAALPAERCPDDDDPHMGDGLTEQEGAGAWDLKIEDSDPVRYLLRSPIWSDSPLLESGYIVLTEKEILSWTLIRRKAIAQSGCYVMPDSSKKPVWDGRKGSRLFKRLLARSTRAVTPAEFDRVLAAAEYVLDLGRRAPLVTEDKRKKMAKEPIFRTEDDAILYKLRALATEARKDFPSLSYDTLRDASKKYAEKYTANVEGVRCRLYRLSTAKIVALEEEITRRDTTTGAPGQSAPCYRSDDTS